MTANTKELKKYIMKEPTVWKKSKLLWQKTDFTLVGMYDDYTWESPKEDCQRIVFVAKGAE